MRAYDKAKSRRNRRLVRQLLNREWDPIGVADAVPDEYDTYADKLYVMLIHDHATAAEMADYLWWVETDYIGMQATPLGRKRCEQVVAQLIEMRPQFEAANDA